MINRPSVPPADHKMQQKGGPSTDQVVLWARFLVGAGSSHTEDIKNIICYLHGSQDEVGTTKHNWSALEALQDPQTETGGGYGTRQHFSSPHLDAILRSAVSGHRVSA